MDTPRAPSAPLVFEEPRRAGRALDGSPVVRLQPRTVGQLLDGGFEVLRFRFRTIAVVAATLVLPLYVLPQVLAVVTGTQVSQNPLFGSSSSFGSTTQPIGSGFVAAQWYALGAALGLALASMLLGVGVSHLVCGWLIGVDRSANETLRFVLRRTPVVLGAFVLALLLKALGALACCIGLLFVVPLLSVLAPVVGAEDLGAASSVSRTWKLGKRRLGPLIGVSLLWGLVSSALSLGVQTAAAAAGYAVSNSVSGASITVQVVSVVSTVLLLVVQVSVTVLVYIDLRVRTEGLDLQMDAAERFPVAVA
ncbi:MAG: hypothetical protein U0Q22_16805 [Acidimicrobiales bacterium]